VIGRFGKGPQEFVFPIRGLPQIEGEFLVFELVENLRPMTTHLRLANLS